jgi:hypothetical protein
MNESILDENTRVGTLLFCTINTEAENSVCKTSKHERLIDLWMDGLISKELKEGKF